MALSLLILKDVPLSINCPCGRHTEVVVSDPAYNKHGVFKGAYVVVLAAPDVDILRGNAKKTHG